MNLYQKPSGIWAVDYFEDGKRRRVSLGTRDKPEARRRAIAAVNGERFDTEVPTGRPTKTATEVGTTVRQLFRRCMNDKNVWMLKKSQATLRSNDGILCRAEFEVEGRRITFGDLDITEADDTVMAGLVSWLEGQGYAQASIKRKMDMVSRAFKQAVTWKLIPAKPELPSITVPDNSRKRVLSAREEVAVFKAIDRRALEQPAADWPRIGRMVRFLLDTGCRKAEAENLRAEWVTEIDLGDRTVHRMTIPSWVTKNGKARTIPLTPAVVSSLPDLIRAGQEAPDSAPPGRLLFPYSGSFLWYRWKIIVADLKKSGYDLSDVVLHTFRHTCLTRLSERGLPIEKVADWAGHSDISITMKHYRHVEASGLDIGASLLA